MEIQFKKFNIIIALSILLLLGYFQYKLTLNILLDDKFNFYIKFWLSLFAILLDIILLREIKVKWNAVQINRDSIVIKPILGILNSEIIPLECIDGFTIIREPTKFSERKVICLYANGNRKVEISEFFCKDFDLVIAELKKKTKKLGKEGFDYFEVYANAFGRKIKTPANKI
ncbi:hypothetical protein TH63_03335 [Rufibacter radiotolerans]|uniref:Uncharacterized protein n=1 Tax=Rufibacter radiotolerans TaxID=1379910 RepID=A0A0H4VLT1_9BACT|nr:hypothetical protein [Rufibacter radiotolerans]AKQ44872.1 hypothetical protein TH63_03335 [Rufibacter radiotolerans]